MKFLLLFLAFSAVGGVHASHSIAPYGTEWPWMLSLRKIGGIDVIQLHDASWTTYFHMYANEVTPAQFSLTYNLLKEALMNPNFTSIDILNYSNNRFYSVQVNYQ